MFISFVIKFKFSVVFIVVSSIVLICMSSSRVNGFVFIVCKMVIFW